LTDVVILVTSEVISAGLAVVLVYIFLKAYRLTRSVYLLGLPFGFSFLAFSYLSLGASLLHKADSVFSEGFLWLYLVTQTFGFALIAFSYYFSKRTEERAKHVLEIVSLGSVTSILLILLGLYVAPPCLGLPSNDVAEEGFRIANLFFLVYVVYTLVRNWRSSKQPISLLAWAPSAFSIFAVGQYSQLIYEIDGSQSAFIFAHVLRIASLILLIHIYYASGRIRNESGEAY
jgi:hypothetical protein